MHLLLYAAHNRASLGLRKRFTAAAFRVFFAFPCQTKKLVNLYDFLVY